MPKNTNLRQTLCSLVQRILHNVHPRKSSDPSDIYNQIQDKLYQETKVEKVPLIEIPDYIHYGEFIKECMCTCSQGTLGYNPIPKVIAEYCDKRKHLPKIILTYIYGSGVMAIMYRAVYGKLEGKQIGWDENRQQAFEWNYANNFLDGEQYSWFENGNMELKHNFVAGRAEGKHFGWHENGRKRYVHNFVNDMLEGEQNYWYENGRRSSKCYYVNGRLQGKSIGWHKNGKKSSETIYVDSNVVSSVEWDEKGVKIRSFSELKR